VEASSAAAKLRGQRKQGCESEQPGGARAKARALETRSEDSGLAGILAERQRGGGAEAAATAAAQLQLLATTNTYKCTLAHRNPYPEEVLSRVTQLKILYYILILK